MYKTIPVDQETYEMIEALCQAYEMGKRSKGAMVRRLVKREYELLKYHLVRKIAVVDEEEGDDE